MAGSGGQNRFPKEESLAGGLRGILEGRDSQGAVVRGERGSGKRHSVDKAITDSGFVGEVYRLSGTRYGRSIEYGAIHFLLIDLEEDQITSPVIVFGALRQRFEAGHEVPLFILENLACLDPWSTTVIAQLAQAGIVRLFVLDDFQAELPEDILGLLRSGILADKRVLPLSVPAVDEFIRESTNLRPSSLVTSTLWAYSEGNAEWLDVILREFMEAGVLQRSQGALILSAGPWPVGQRMLATARMRIERLSPVQHAVLELMAGQQSVEPELLDGFPPHEVDDLHADGLLEYANSPNRVVRISSRILEECLRAMATNERRWEVKELAPVGANVISGFDGDPEESDRSELDRVLGSLPQMIRAGGSQRALELVSHARHQTYGVLSMNPEIHLPTCQLTDRALELLAWELRLALRTGDDELVENLIAVLNPIRNEFCLHHMESPQLHEASASLLEAVARANRGADASVLVDWLTEVCLLRGRPSAGRSGRVAGRRRRGV